MTGHARRSSQLSNLARISAGHGAELLYMLQICTSRSSKLPVSNRPKESTMPTYRVRFTTQAEVSVDIDAEDADAAADDAWQVAQDYLDTLTPDSHGTSINVSLDGTCEDSVVQVA